MFSDIQITETTLVAVITFFSGAVGAVVGLLGSIIAARRSERAQTARVVIESSYQARLHRFQEVFLTANDLLAVSSDETQRSAAIVRFNHAISSARLVASFETTVHLIQYQDRVFDLMHGVKNLDELSAINADLTIAMQKDMAVFTAPVVVKNRWLKKSTLKGVRAWLKSKLRKRSTKNQPPRKRSRP